ncbi:MAG: RdgB/HAM1 family non-canonical purine NTP pyrophosphatase [Methylococcaceae bacterium]|nr:RdgB/HAM1 family non-canonical purine NTP pyrophosphatase [Methylococcaceae bacterium]
MKKVLLASNNPGKIREIQAILAEHDLTVMPQSEFGVGDVDETGLTFVENALIKARHAAALSGLPAIADDSGLEVDVLGGAPGVHSARYAGLGATDAKNNEKLLAALAGVPQTARTARFRCVMVYLRHAADPSPVIAEGVWHGLILEEARGSAGFGYDPLFYVPEHQRTSAELDAVLKNRISHRSQALRSLASALMGSREFQKIAG